MYIQCARGRPVKELWLVDCKWEELYNYAKSFESLLYRY